MHLVTDLHLRSRYAMSTSPRLDVANLARAARRKGVKLIAAPDFTHPTWRTELKEQLTETSPGSGIFTADGTSFMLVAELSCVWRQDGRARRVHLLLSAPSFEAVDKISERLAKIQNLESDGRPTLKISVRDLLQTAIDIDPRCTVIPAHAFTPWYGIFGAKTGFDSLKEPFGDLTDQVLAIESGLSADPEMMANIPDCASRSIVSFSDAHSLENIGREATVLDIAELSYDSVVDALRNHAIVETLEFHPAHGKYHLDGHRKCGIRFTPEVSRAHGNLCPVCDRPLTLGVLHRTQALSDTRPQGTGDASSQAFRHIVPMRDVIAHSQGIKPTNTKRISQYIDALVDQHGPELDLLLHVRISKFRDVRVTARGGVIMLSSYRKVIAASRKGDIIIEPGYDGEYGSVSINTMPNVIYRSGYGARVPITNRLVRFCRSDSHPFH